MKRNETITKISKRTGKEYEKESSSSHPYTSKVRNYEEVLDLYSGSSEPSKSLPSRSIFQKYWDWIYPANVSHEEIVFPGKHSRERVRELKLNDGLFVDFFDKIEKPRPGFRAKYPEFQTPEFQVEKEQIDLGKLEIKDFKNLESIWIDIKKENCLTELNIIDCPSLKSLTCVIGNLVSIDFLNQLSNPEKLEYLNIHSNNIQPTDISIFSRFINLGTLKIGTSDWCLKRGKRNHFYGSLKSYQNLTKLESICIEATDISEGLEYLPLSLVKSTKERTEENYKFGGGYDRIECSPHNLDVGCKNIQDALRPYDYDLEAWQLTHPHLMYVSYPEYFTQEDSKEKWLKALEDKLVKTQEKLNETKQNEPEAVKRILRLKSKIKLLEEIQVKVDAKKKTNDELNKETKENKQKVKEAKTNETQAVIEYVMPGTYPKII